MFLGRDQNNIRDASELLTDHWRDLENERVRIVRARVRASFVGTCVRVCRTSLYLSLGWVASPWHTINTGANLPMKRTVPVIGRGPRKNVRLSTVRTRPDTHASTMLRVASTGRIICSPRHLPLYGRAPTRRRVLHSGRMTHARLRAIPFLRP